VNGPYGPGGIRCQGCLYPARPSSFICPTIPPKIRRRMYYAVLHSATPLEPFGWLFGVAHCVVTHSCRPSLWLVAYCTVHRPKCPIRSTVQTRVSRDPFAGQQRPDWCAIPSFSLGSLYAAALACSPCQRRSRRQQISASLRAAATLAIFALERFRTRV